MNREKRIVMRVVIVNQYNSDNIGDNLIGTSMRKFFLTHGVEVELAGYAQTTFQRIQHSEMLKGRSVVSKLKRICPPILKYILVYRKAIDEEIRRISNERIDALIIGGGQLIKHKSVFVYCFRKWTRFSKKKHIPLYVYGVGVDSNLNLFERVLFSEGIKYACGITCRETSSAVLLRQLYKCQVEEAPDAVFSMDLASEKSDEENLIVMPYSFSLAKSHFHSLKSKEDYYNHLFQIIVEEHYEKLILTATTSIDLGECYAFSEYLISKGIDNVVVEMTDLSDMLKVYSGAYKIVSGRMHAMIIGMICKKEIVPLEISSKISEFNKQYLKGQSELDEIRSASLDGMKKIVSCMEIRV